MWAKFLQRGGAWVLVQFGLMAAVVVLGWQFPGSDWGVWSLCTGTVLMILSGAMGLAGVVVLGRGTTPLPKPSPGARFVQHGIYARMRHPLYTSVMLASLGWAFLWQSGASLVAALALIPFFHAKTRREERWLREQFPEYAGYEQRVPRFLPRFGRHA